MEEKIEKRYRPYRRFELWQGVVFAGAVLVGVLIKSAGCAKLLFVEHVPLITGKLSSWNVRDVREG